MSRVDHGLTRIRAVLVAMGVLLLSYQAVAAWQKIRIAANGDHVARLPFSPRASPDLVEDITPEAREAGIERGDRIVSLAGRTFTGTRTLHEIVRSAKVGDALDVEIASRGEPPRTTTVTLQPVSDRLKPAQVWAMTIFLAVVMPLSALLLGLWTVLARPRDVRAWLVFAVLFSLDQMVRPGTELWPVGLAEMGAFLGSFGMRTWPAWMLLFGVYFPERLPWERRLGWAKWVLAGPVLMAAPFYAAIDAGRIANAPAMEGLFRLVSRLGFTGILGMVCVGGFFFLTGWKTGTLSDPDSRRRVRLLLFGSQLALSPLFILVLMLYFGGVSPDRLPLWFLVMAFAAVPIFPLTLAYVIVVERAMDVRVTLRLGVRYLIAKNGLRLAIFAGLQPLGIAVGWFHLRGDASLPVKWAVLAAYLLLCAGVARRARRVMAAIDRRFFRDQYDEEQLLTELSERVRTIVDPEALFDTLSERIDQALHAQRVAVLTTDEGGAFRVAHARGFVASSAPSLPGDGAVAKHLAASTGPTLLSLRDDGEWTRDGGTLPPRERDALRELGAAMLLPLATRGRLLGILSLGPKRSEQPYSATDRRLLRSVAVQAGFALENARLASEMAKEVARREKISREIEIAREVQETLFPRQAPKVAGVEVAGMCRPASGVGGDYFDYFGLPDGSLALALGDVAGKGIPAALLMASLQASLRGQALRGASDLAALVGDMNRLLCDASPDNRYATFFVARWDPKLRTLDWVNAGHNPPVVLSADRETRLERTGSVVGLLPEAKYASRRMTLSPGDTLVTYSDGISEAWNHAEEEWGEKRLVASIRAASGETAPVVVERVLRDADAFTGGAPQHDDMTVVVLKVR